MEIKIWRISNTDCEVEEMGYITAKEFHADECWHICNWGCYTDDKPENLHSELDVVNSDVVFHNPKEDKYYLALPVGWYIGDTIEEVIDYKCNR